MLHRSGEHDVQEAQIPGRVGDDLPRLDDEHGIELESFGGRGRQEGVVFAQRGRCLPVEKWHEAIGEPTLADAILDRLVHNAYRLELKGESLRKTKALKGLDPVSSAS